MTRALSALLLLAVANITGAQKPAKDYLRDIYTFRYETRRETEQFLKDIREDRSCIDYDYIWSAYSRLMSWARIDPALGGEDLRPCPFVARDRRAYFSGSTASSRLEEWADRLMRPSMVVAAN